MSHAVSDFSPQTPAPPQATEPAGSAPLTTIEKLRRLKFALAGDASNTVYLSLATAGSILLLFLEKIHLDKSQMGVLLAALGFGPMIAPLAAQIGARIGFKRVGLTFTVLRVFLLSGMIFAPQIAKTRGPGIAFAYVAVVLVAFSLTRSTADSQGGPWSMDYVPPEIRGKYTAIQTIVTMSCGALALLIVGALLGTKAPLVRFQWCFAAAIVFGLLPAVAYSVVPGGQPHPQAKIRLRGTLRPLKDPVYRRHLLGHMTINFGWCVTTPFVPLYLKNYVGLPPDQIVTLDAITMLGSLCSSFLWGWAADRYGGKPIMVSLLSLHVIYAIGMLLIPQHSYISHAWAIATVFILGFISIGWTIGFYRYFFNDLIPAGPARTDYIALNSAMAGLMVGAGPLLAGWLLDRMSSVSGHLGPVAITPYTPLFLGLIVCVLLSTWLMGGLPSRGAIPTRQFASMFLQANLLTTLPNLMAFRYAGLEEKRIHIVGRLGMGRSPLSVEELIDALDDPSFGVCYEAIISVTRTRPDPRLTDALLKVVGKGDPGLQMAAVWALGRIGDPKALRVLRPLLESPYRTMRAQIARALGMLEDFDSMPKLLAMFRSEPEVAVRVAIGSALARLECRQVMPGLLELLRQLADQGPHHRDAVDSRRREVSLAIATLLGHDDQALRLWRRMYGKPGDTLGATMLALRRRLKDIARSGDVVADVERCAYAFAANELVGGAMILLNIIDAIASEALTPEAWCVLAECATTISTSGIARREHLLLAVHALHVGLV